MKETHSPDSPDSGWHAEVALLDAYADGLAGPVDIWSVEAHLIGCAHCRAALSTRMSSTDVRILAASRSEVLANLGTVSSFSHRSVRRWLRWALRPAPLLAVAFLVAGVAVVDVLVGGGDPTGRLIWLLAPAVPVAAVALTAVGEDDPCREAVLAAPSAILRVNLWRTLAVVTLAIPLATAVGRVQGTAAGNGWLAAAWLLPCLALTATTLAAGTLVGVERAARVITLLWCAALLGPALLASGDDIVAGLRLTATASGTPAVFSGPAQALWVVAIAVAIAVLLSNRARYDLLR